MEDKEILNLKELCTKLDFVFILIYPRNFVVKLFSWYVWHYKIIRIKNDRIIGISLENFGLLDLPEEIFNFNDLKTLRIKFNLLGSLPTSLGLLENLKELDVSENLITTLPTSIGECNLLKEFNAKSNDLIELPDSFGKLTNLNVLDLSNNKITKIPDCIFKLKNLVKINLSNNYITSIPSEINNLENVEAIYINNNLLETLPNELLQLPKLKFIDITSNSIELKKFETIQKLQEKKIVVMHDKPNSFSKTKKTDKVDHSKFFNGSNIMIIFSIFLFLSLILGWFKNIGLFVLGFAILFGFSGYFLAPPNFNNRQNLKVLKTSIYNSNKNKLKIYSFISLVDVFTYSCFSFDLFYIIFQIADKRTFILLLSMFVILWLGLLIVPLFNLVFLKKSFIKVFDQQLIPIKLYNNVLLLFLQVLFFFFQLK